MANGGWCETKEEWNRREIPLLELDDTLSHFAQANSLHLSKNLKDHPERSLAWGKTVRCLIQIYLVGEVDLTFNFWTIAWEDRGSKRFAKSEFLKERAPIAEIENNLTALLQTAKQKLDYWQEHPDELEFAVEIESRR